MSKNKQEDLTFRNAYAHERRDFGQVKPYTQTHTSAKDYNRRKGKRETKREWDEMWYNLTAADNGESQIKSTR